MRGSLTGPHGAAILHNPLTKGGAVAYKITDKCIACGNCQGECPVEAISEGDRYSIDPAKCIDCGACASVCPVEAIQAP